MKELLHCEEFLWFKEKEALEEMLERSQESLEESKSYIGQLRSQQKDEKRERARCVLNYGTWI